MSSKCYYDEVQLLKKAEKITKKYFYVEDTHFYDNLFNSIIFAFSLKTQKFKTYEKNNNTLDKSLNIFNTINVISDNVMVYLGKPFFSVFLSKYFLYRKDICKIYYNHIIQDFYEAGIIEVDCEWMLMLSLQYVLKDKPQTFSDYIAAYPVTPKMEYRLLQMEGNLVDLKNYRLMRSMSPIKITKFFKSLSEDKFINLDELLNVNVNCVQPIKAVENKENNKPKDDDIPLVEKDRKNKPDCRNQLYKLPMSEAEFYKKAGKLSNPNKVEYLEKNSTSSSKKTSLDERGSYKSKKSKPTLSVSDNKSI